MKRSTHATRSTSPNHPPATDNGDGSNTETPVAAPAPEPTVSRKQKRKLVTDNEQDGLTRQPVRRRRQKKANNEGTVRNNDYCEACGGPGRFICCDACPKAFHFTCVEPPMDFCDVEKLKGNWYCRECKERREQDAHTTDGQASNSPSSLTPMQAVFGSLMRDMERQNPKAFLLPKDMRTFFDGVSCNRNGEYVDDAVTKPVRYNRAGDPERPDYHRLKDKHGNSILCFYCRKSALKKPIIDCDFCPHHWHLDCLTPPMTAPPNPAKKWMCPLHAEPLLPRQRKVRKSPLVSEIQQHFNRITLPHVGPDPEAPPLSNTQQTPQIAETLVRHDDAVYRIPAASITLAFPTGGDCVRDQPQSAANNASGAHPAISPQTSYSKTPDMSHISPHNPMDANAESSKEWQKSKARFQESIALLANQAKLPVNHEHGMHLLAQAAKAVRRQRPGRPFPAPSGGRVLRPRSATSVSHTASATGGTPTPDSAQHPSSLASGSVEASTSHENGRESSLAHAIEELGKDSLVQAIKELVKRKGRDAVLKLLAEEAVDSET